MQNTHKKMIKLGKSRLWPSIVFFIFSLIMGIVLILGEFMLFVTHMVENKYDQTREQVHGYATTLDELISDGKTPEEAFDQLVAISGPDAQLFIADKDGQVIAIKGENTVDNSYGHFMETFEGDEIYFDAAATTDRSALEGGSRSKNLGDIDPYDLFVMLQETQSKTSDENEGMFSVGEHTKDAVMSYEFWQVSPIAATGDKLYVKSMLTIQKDDFAFSIAVLILSGFMFFFIITVQFANVIRQVRLRRRLQKLLNIDPITDGKSLFAYEENMLDTMGKKSNFTRNFAVVDLSVTKYQSYCFLHGTQAGDGLLTTVDRVFSSYLSYPETVAHVNGADFALFLCAGDGPDAERQLMDRVASMVAYFPLRAAELSSNSIQMPGTAEKIKFKAGICMIEASSLYGLNKKQRMQVDYNKYYLNASIAKDSLPEAEEGVAFFTQEMREEQMWEDKVENSMQQALDAHEFKVYVQPKYDPNSGELQGAEALVRWISPSDGFISPGRFIPIFEKTGLITKLDDYMISQVAALQRSWLDQGKEIVPISVNVSRAHFADPDLAEHIRALVDAYELPHEYIEIELTESAFFDDKKLLLNTVNKLKELGFKVSMDDFGSGYSSLNSLKDLPLDVLKLDAGFFRGDIFDSRGEIVVSEAIALAKRLNMKIVAEGIENKEQVDFLAGLDCDMIQGYYYARPMPADEYAADLK